MTRHLILFSFFNAFLLAIWTACGPTTISTQENCSPECDSWESCVDGQCIQSCINDVECGSNSFCINSLCSAIVPCQSTGQCEADASCLNGFCIPVNRQCGNSAPCAVGDCVNGICTTGPSNEEEPRCSSGDDCPAGQECVFGFCQEGSGDGNSNDSSGGSSDGNADGNSDSSSNDDCNGNDDGQLGDSCNEGSDCCNGLCLGDPNTGQGFCTAPCTTYEQCNPVGFNLNMLCIDTGQDGSLCAFSDYGQSCESTNDCIGQVCLVSAIDNACTLRCDSGALCPPGAACGYVYADDGVGGTSLVQTCAPIGSACSLSSDCLTGTCLTDSATGTGYCSIFCQSTDPTSCPNSYTCSPIEGSDMPVCIR